ncbi:MAG: M20/M25/M40 family metallo-hydrolase [Bacteroidota bacterium]
MKIFLIWCILFLFSFSFSFSQNIDYAREVIKKMSSPEFNGRGYTNNGDKIAADYLKNELVKFNIKPLGEYYFQYFNISINSIQSVNSVKIDGKTLVQGKDYIIYNNSKGCKGSFEIQKIDTTYLSYPQKFECKDKFILIDQSEFKSEEAKKVYQLLKYINFCNAKGIIDLTDKHPSQTMSQREDNFAVINLRKGVADSIPKNIKLSFKNKFLENYQTQNVVGYIEGEVDTFIMFGAHYDHLGNMGKKIYFPGANDNASGCSMLLNFAEYFSKADEKPHYSILFAFFSAEEVGILGSKYFSENPLVPLEKIRFFFNLDLVGTGEDGIKIVNGTIFEKEYELLNYINDENEYLPAISMRGEAMNSDHYYLYKKGVPSFFIYTMGGYSEYHNIYDIEETLKLTEYEDLFRLIRDFVLVVDFAGK